MNSTLLAGAVGLLVALLLTPRVKVLAARWGVVAHPGGRRVHARATPMLGGIAMYVGFVVAFAVAVLYDPSLLEDPGPAIGIMVGGTFMAIMGVIDDKLELPGWVQAASMLIGGVILVIFGVYVQFITNPFRGGEMLELGRYLGVPITVVWVLMVTKAVDCMDGLDGLAAGISAIAALTLTLMALTAGDRFRIYGVMAAALFGVCLGFLRFNYPPAKIFMGTVGAQFLGFTLAGVSIAGAFKIATLVAVAVPVLVMGVPLFDTAFVVLRRILTGKRIHEADTTHLHHRLVSKGLSHRQVIWFIYALTTVSCALAFALFRHAK